MKVGSKLIMMVRDTDGFGGAAAIAEALQPNPNSLRLLRRLEEESFELSLERYGINHLKASGTLVHFVPHSDIDKPIHQIQVSVLLLENYEPPILACAVNQVLLSITAENSSPTIVIPFILPSSSSKLKTQTRNFLMNDHDQALLYGLQLGPETDITRTMLSRTQKPPSSLKILHESLACILHFLRILNLPTFVIIGQRGRAPEFEVLYEIGELLASTSSLCFLRERITWNPTKTSREGEEPWRALYG